MSNKEEYFETSDFQIRIREGYRQLLSGELEMPVPFDMGAVVGPVSNEGTHNQLRTQLKEVIRGFLHSRPNPINVQTEQVDQFRIRKIVRESKNQSRLSDIGLENAKRKTDWLDGKKPWKILKEAQDSHLHYLASVSVDSDYNQSLPKNILNHSMSSVCGTLALLNSVEIPEMRSAMGPVRCVSERHTQRIVKFLREMGWITQRKNLIGREAPKSRLRAELFSFGYLALAIWPLRRAISQWQSRNPDTHLRFSLGQLAKSDLHERALLDTISRLSILGSGTGSRRNPETIDTLVDWWSGK